MSDPLDDDLRSALGGILDLAPSPLSAQSTEMVARNDVPRHRRRRALVLLSVLAAVLVVGIGAGLTSLARQPAHIRTAEPSATAAATVTSVASPAESAVPITNVAAPPAVASASETLQPTRRLVTILIWALLAVVLLAVELHHLAFFAMFGAAGAAAAAVTAALAPTAIPLQILLAIIVAAVGLVAVRPHMSRAFARRGPGLVIGGVHGGLVGARGITTDEVSPRAGGHVRLLGENWLAVTDPFGPPIPPATHVIVTAVVGTTLTVTPAYEEYE
jgi:membrane protein implicated in regulation of membrane protease activity